MHSLSWSISTTVVAVAMLTLLSVSVSVNAQAGKVLKPPMDDADHSNYGDMGKAKEFAKEHMGERGKNLTEREELMMLFSIHDTNKDGYLDGIELRAAFSQASDPAKEDSNPQLELEKMIEMIDHVIAEDDINNDGKISWEEYLISQKYHEG
ncbi:hypothetical protein BX616_009484 [Lobosporangium transversale]|uniref:EF-hand domain-containing protein n=1 Tax=Lobosporangium transversale TaxID=64571 RepID=A0A1Y2H2R7_9FUNG|nr:hypothetical protein BCR41DRAFT_417957 [Lobosporangium transversale]KAF9913834.1 hypothetical protein BX616_009484 [Lobosporangium transversale]ORZ28847.1 hypothetical protein BCR41DRAFT_417957 [Lobosporangium transversale]|eukprot:XP_021886520.1 hypothetical protein BCR41DRAFT_417957 [Lobosporangium transversale]